MNLSFRLPRPKCEKMLALINKRFKEFVKDIGGPTLAADISGLNYRTIKSATGSKLSPPSPHLVHQLVEVFKDSVDDHYTREWLRPDVKPLQWQRLDKVIKEYEEEN